MADKRAHEKNLVIFTDLDGTLLDRETYSWTEAQPAIDMVKELGIPLIFCSAKTRAEQEVIRTALGIHDPFIVEDGGAAYIERGYFDFTFECVRVINGYCIIEFGLPYEDIREVSLEVAAENGLWLRSYGDMDAEEVARITGLDHASAARAREREYEAQLVGDFSEDTIELLDHAFRSHGLRTTHGGRFYGVMGHAGKGEATLALIDMFRKHLGKIVTVGIGDSSNDASLLRVVDIPVLVKKPDDTYESLDIPNLRTVDGVGPAGWRRFVLELLS
jgi:mannosyl-3-phosphoglycerate phosphatase